jgi:hypothetical protein
MATPWYRVVALDLINTTVIGAGFGVIGAIVLSRFPSLWRDGRLDGLTRSLARRGWLWVLLIGIASFLVYAVTARLVFSGRPLLIDEIVQVYQARILTQGRLWIPAAPHSEFFSSLHVVEQDGRIYSQFPVGGPAMLALGSLVRAEWLVGPAFGAASVVVFGCLIRRIEPRPLVALGALLLFALAPFQVFMSASHMNHVTALFWILVATYGLVRATGAAGSWQGALLVGLGLGVAATIRPIDAAAFAIPAGLWLLADAVRFRRLGPLIAAGSALLLPLLVLGWANREMTGSAFRFGYTVLWGAGHGLGFHTPPWGEAHTPARGFELINTYFLRLQTYLFETGVPSLLPAAAAFALARKLSAFDRYLVAASGLLVGFYLAYWHDGFYLGPRFMFPWLPLLAIWTARIVPLLRDRLSGRPLLRRGILIAGLTAVAIGLLWNVPNRARQYRSGLQSLRWDPDRAARQAGIHDALILVRESWGAELVARLWALQVSRPKADALYRKSDPCRLDSAMTVLEAGMVRGEAASAVLDPLRADSARLLATPISGDPSLRLVPGRPYSGYCVERIRRNQSGFTLFAPLLLAREKGRIFARDLGARDSLLVLAYPDLPVYLLKPEGAAVGAPPVFHPLKKDSLFSAWRSGAW